MTRVINFLFEEDGVTAVEYAVMLALIIAVCFATVAFIGLETARLMDPDGSLTGAMSGGD